MVMESITLKTTLPGDSGDFTSVALSLPRRPFSNLFLVTMLTDTLSGRRKDSSVRSTNGSQLRGASAMVLQPGQRSTILGKLVSRA